MRSEVVAILIDGGFYQKRAKVIWGDMSPKDGVNLLHSYLNRHLCHKRNNQIEFDHLYRVFYYDCPPADHAVFHPLKGSNVNLKKSPIYEYMTAFHQELIKRRKTALRLGKLASPSSNGLAYVLKDDAQKQLINKSRDIDSLTESDFRLSLQQKGVDMRIGLDVASLAYKKQVTRIILIAGDSDFVPVAKLARREGIDFLLDPMKTIISKDLLEHIDGLKSFTHISTAELLNRTNSSLIIPS